MGTKSQPSTLGWESLCSSVHLGDIPGGKLDFFFHPSGMGKQRQETEMKVYWINCKYFDVLWSLVLTVNVYVCVVVCWMGGGEGQTLPKGKRGGVLDESVPTAKLEWINSGISLSTFNASKV